MSHRTQLSKALEEERRRSSTLTPPSDPKELIQVTTSKDEKQQWITDMEGHQTDVFDLLNFDFMPVGTKMVGEKIQDTLTSQSLGEDWNQLPPLP